MCPAVRKVYAKSSWSTHMKTLLIALIVIVAALAVGAAFFMIKADADRSAANAEIATLREQLKKLDGLVPDQAAVMSHAGYHFANLWFAADQENWPLADFYLNETRANIKWAVRAKPFRKGPNGENIDLGAIAQAMDNTNLAGLKLAIDARQKTQFAALYTETLSLCYACHKASGKPYLRPQIPASPEARMINMNPQAKFPQ